MKHFLALLKPRIAVMVMATAGLGFWLAGGHGGLPLIWVLLGTGLSSGACGCLNQYLEREPDGRMRRTRNRPLPAGNLAPNQALLFGIFLALTGLGILGLKVNGLALGLTALTLTTYLVLYTPLKRITPHCTWIGAVAGATPPLIGWAAERSSLDAPCWALFAIQFLWQIPHFLAMFWMHREDYARAGFRVMPVVDPEGQMTALQIALYSFAVVPASLMPSLCGMAGVPYSIGALALGTGYLTLGMKASWTLAAMDTRRLFLASLAYLPILFGMLVLGVA